MIRTIYDDKIHFIDQEFYFKQISCLRSPKFYCKYQRNNSNLWPRIEVANCAILRSSVGQRKVSIIRLVA
ncbi:unnamed protein product [Blepharisma stoltei]|uniref:Uncharacterized protein n=1 Tax=Blepharisma stoltei TaxID=1481888 RepID=A0AAU9IXK4_9CILI|nr:unnamed protein product [Blepharisma stoltei]